MESAVKRGQNSAHFRSTYITIGSIIWDFMITHDATDSIERDDILM